MNNDAADQRLQARFGELREQQARQTPAFARVWCAAEHRQAVRLDFRWLRPAAAAALLALGSAVAVYHLKPQPAAADPSQWAVLSNWQASTDVLLAVASTPWGSQVVTPSDVWMDTDVSGSETTQNNTREML